MDFHKGRWAPNTQAAYDVGWRDWETWCRLCDRSPLPAEPQAIASFIRFKAETLKWASISQRLAAIRAVHKDAKAKLEKTNPDRELYTLDDPIITDACKEVQRVHGSAKTPKAAIVTKDLKRIIKGIPADHAQDIAVLLVGFAGALRRSELVALNVDDLEFSNTGLTITIRRSKTDKSGKGEPVAILRSGSETCAVAALEYWLNDITFVERGGDGGPIFRTERGTRMAAATVAKITKHWAQMAGFDPRPLGAHSLRRGCITSMFRGDAKIEEIMRHSRHKTVGIALGYVEAQQALANPAIKALGL